MLLSLFKKQIIDKQSYGLNENMFNVFPFIADFCVHVILLFCEECNQEK